MVCGVVCVPCEVDGRQSCDHCKKPNCRNERKETRQVCKDCDRQDHVKCSQLHRKRKETSVFFSDKRRDHAKEEKAILHGISPFKKKSVHYVHPRTALQKGCLPAHHYTEFQFCNKQLLEGKTDRGEEKPSKIKVLADQNFGRAIEDCLPMDDVLKEIAEAGRAMLCSRHEVSDLTFAAATLHVQDDNEAKRKITTIYPPHTDKPAVGQQVMFHQVSGLSFTFIAVEGKEGEAHFDTSSQGYERYEEWKAHSSNESAIEVQMFENNFLKQAGRNKKTTSVEVYELRGGRSLCFAADYYCHASIVPAQVRETRRALLIFHQLLTVPILSGEPPRTREKKAAKKMEMQRKKVLFLGMTYLDPARLRGKLTDKELSVSQPLQKKHMEQLVEKKEVQTQDGRDTWRTLAVEKQRGCDVFTVACVSLFQPDERHSAMRHFQTDWNLRCSCERLEKEKHVFEQICLDYFWLQQGWQGARITDGIITHTIIGFAKKNLTQTGCKVVLPFTTHINALALRHDEQVKEHCEVQHRSNNKTEDLALHTTTCAMDEEKMASIFEKDLEGQAKDCLTHARQSVKQSLDQDPEKRESFMTLQLDIPSIRFIVLKRRK